MKTNPSANARDAARSPLPSATVKENYVVAGGIRTRYFDAGNGPAVILLHGSSLAIDAWSTWHNTIPALACAFRVLAPDLVGFGLSDVPADGKHVPRLERRHHVSAFIEALGINRCALVGHSEGGFIAAMLAVENPGLVDKVVVVSSGATAPRLGANEDHAWKSAAAAAYNVLEGCNTEEDFLRTNARLSTKNPPEFVELLRKNYRLACETGQLERFRQAARIKDDTEYIQIQEDHLLPHLPTMQAKLFLAWSRCDETVPVARGIKLLERAPQADMHIFADAAHMVMIDRPQEFNCIVSMWLRS
ncbi:alpha/beta hydrolase [Mesorhizobium sp. M1066]|uniref:alpha/beta fold hydrolase n=1 Tax=unclassified Mesorhizobium TaxID=325217 RepID=UPI00333CD893